MQQKSQKSNNNNNNGGKNKKRRNKKKTSVKQGMQKQYIEKKTERKMKFMANCKS